MEEDDRCDNKQPKNTYGKQLNGSSSSNSYIVSSDGGSYDNDKYLEKVHIGARKKNTKTAFRDNNPKEHHEEEQCDYYSECYNKANYEVELCKRSNLNEEGMTDSVIRYGSENENEVEDDDYDENDDMSVKSVRIKNQDVQSIVNENEEETDNNGNYDCSDLYINHNETLSQNYNDYYNDKKIQQNNKYIKAHNIKASDNVNDKIIDKNKRNGSYVKKNENSEETISIPTEEINKVYDNHVYKYDKSDSSSYTPYENKSESKSLLKSNIARNKQDINKSNVLDTDECLDDFYAIGRPEKPANGPNKMKNAEKDIKYSENEDLDAVSMINNKGFNDIKDKINWLKNDNASRCIPSYILKKRAHI